MLLPTSTSSTLSAPIDLSLVRRLFADASAIAGADFLRREIAARMEERLALVKIDPKLVLDAGCGEGADLLALHKRFPNANLVGLDASPAMLQAALQRRTEAQSALNRMLAKWLPAAKTDDVLDLICADFAATPLSNNSADLIWSNLALHWHPQPDRVFAEWRRLLRVDGLLMFSCFGPDTLKEIRTAFAALDAAPHALPFVDMHDFGDMLVEVGFSTPVMDMETITVTYTSVDKLMADVRALGGNPLSNRRRGLISKASWRRVMQVLEQLRRPDGTIGLSFEVIYGHAFRPISKTTASGEAIIRFK